ncbi:MAG TPA: peptidylprolyl isomerase [Anaeromyxobacteraceae bacterium]|nr:peptidylprolyl isomerase [Anaeromyxobacteraceae bacterium]
MPRALCLASALLASFSAPAQEARGRVVDRVAAIVNGEVVTLADLEERAAPDLRKATASAAGSSRDRTRRQALQAAFDAIVAERLFASQVSALGVEVSDVEIDAVVEDVKRRNGLDDARLDAALSAQGMDRASYRKAVKRDLESMRLVQLKIRNKVKVTDEDVKNYWQTHPQEFRAGEEIRVRHIFLALASNASAREVERVRGLASKISARLRAGEDFGVIARAVSQGPSASEGGELGWLRQGTVQPDVEKVAFALQPGQISEPLRTSSGIQIIQVEDRRGGGERPLDEVKDQVRDRLVNEQGDAYRAQYLAELRKDAVIEVKLPELSAD